MKLFIKYLPIALIILSYWSISSMCIVNLRPAATLTLFLYILMIIGSSVYYLKNRHKISGDKLIWFYLIWIFINVIRGFFSIRDNNSVILFINHVTGVLCITYIPLFANSQILATCLRKWHKVCIPFFYISYVILFASSGIYHWFLPPLMMTSVFAIILPKYKRIWLLLPLFLIIPLDWETRSQWIRASVVLLFFLSSYFLWIYSIKIARYVLYSLCLAPFLLLCAAIFGAYNIFQESESQIKSSTFENADTRTFLYSEAIISSIDNKYYLFGRNLARGHDTKSDWANTIGNNSKMERDNDEMAVTSIYTWMGLIGLILYSAIYIYAIVRIYNKSKNNYLRMFAFYLAFIWIYLWVETFVAFNIQNITLAMILALSLSKEYVNMSDSEFKIWYLSIFNSKKKIRLLH